MEPAWGYRIAMPSGWHLVTFGPADPEQFRSFSNEDVLDSNGMVLKITVSRFNSDCPGAQRQVAGSTVPAATIDVDGFNSLVWGYKAQDGSGWGVQATATDGKYCYSFVGWTLNREAQTRWTPVFEQMLSTFTFGTPAAPPF